MSDGTPVQLWHNYLEAQGPLYINPTPDSVYNDAQVFRTWSTGRLMGGDKGKRKTVTGGSEIRFATFFETGDVTAEHQPGETRTWSQPQKAMHGRGYKRYRETHMSWTRQVIMDNEGMRRGDFDAYFNHRMHLEQVMWTDYWKHDERSVWREPDYTEMETQNAVHGYFYSIPAYINEYTNGLFNNSGTAGTQWTTIHGIDPTSSVRGQTGYVHSVIPYSNAITSNGMLFDDSNILTALEKAWMKVDWQKPPKQGEFFDDVSINNQTIYCSPEGQRVYTHALRVSQDALVYKQDSAYNNPTFDGIPFHRTDMLTTATLYPAGTAGAITNNLAESSTDLLHGAGPRFYFVNSNHLFPYFDEDMFFKRGEVRNHYNDPDTFVQPVNIWGNMLCPRRSTHALIRPGGTDLYTGFYA